MFNEDSLHHLSYYFQVRASCLRERKAVASQLPAPVSLTAPWEIFTLPFFPSARSPLCPLPTPPPWSNLETDPAAGSCRQGRTSSQGKTTGELLNSSLLCFGQGVCLEDCRAVLTSRTFCLCRWFRNLASALQ